VEVTISSSHEGRNLVDHPCRLKQSHHFVVDVDRARQRVELALTLDNERAQARSAEKICRERTNGPATHDCDIENHLNFLVD
jgi:hypothetical protein